MPISKPLPFKRRKRTKESTKKLKADTSSNEILKEPDELQNDAKKIKLADLCEDDIENYGELLNGQTIMEGMVILGCVIEVKKDCLIMSLPGCLKGFVPFTNISDAFTKRYNTSDDDLPPLDPRLAVKLGMTFPCKVMKVVPGTFPQKISISLSVNPKDVNENLRPQSLYQKMVLFASVSSQEDSGYIMDVGGKNITAFLRYNTENKINCPLEVGQVIPTLAKSIMSHEGTSSVQLNQLNFNEAFPLIEDENIRLTSILPGARITAYITEVKHPFAYMKCLDFKACAFLMSSGSSYKNIANANEVCGTVLYVHPLTHLIYLHLGRLPTPESFSTYFGVKKYDLVQNAKVQCLYRNKCYCRIPKRCFGFVNKKEFKENEFSKEKLEETSFPRARVTYLHFMDNLVHLTLNKSIVNQEVKTKENFKIGDTCEGFVKKHVEDGVFISLCPGVNGFVRRLHIADVCLTKVRPETLYPLKAKVTCKVLNSDSSNLVQLTLKKSLLALAEPEILKTYEDAVPGYFYKGVVVDIKGNYMLILFFNNVKGIVSFDDIPHGAIYFVGQTVQCEVLQSSPQKKKMKLSLKIKGSSNFQKELAQDASHSSCSFQETVSCEESEDSEILDPCAIKIKSNDYTKADTFEAKIMKITGHQLMIRLGENIKGRVHVSEIGCSKEKGYPLREFSIGQDIQVHIIGDFYQKSHKYLEVSHRRMVCMKECSLKFPEPVSLTMDFCPGMRVMGFIKEVYEMSAVCWLSPKHLGFLDYLNFSDNPKELRKLKKKLDIGLSVSATVLHVNTVLSKDDLGCSIVLTRLGNNLPSTGSNIVGLVQSTCLETGLNLKLPNGYLGKVALCDIQDNYGPLDSAFGKHKKTKFILCHVLDVNHEKKFCNLSLRKSRLYKKKMVDGQFCPELSENDMKKGSIVKGYVSSVCDSFISIHLSRTLIGRITLHSCLSPNCSSCRRSEFLKQSHPVGSVAVTIIEGCASQEENLYNLSFVDHDSSLVMPHRERLNIKKDITWDDL